ncbi:hypothetical protein D3C81_1746420 [compost metagenome]
MRAILPDEALELLQISGQRGVDQVLGDGAHGHNKAVGVDRQTAAGCTTDHPGVLQEA